jgi:serine/threonine-protein kinase
MELARGVIIAGKYRLERPLATGGMGSVWVGRHAHLETLVAIKFMDAQSASSAVARARFEREAKASATLRNRHVVQVLDYGVESDAPYLVMELLNGEDLSKRLHRERRLSLPAMSKILVQTARGLRPAHDAKVVHRDLKPANIFLARSEDEDEEVVKILDFGIAKDMSGTPLGEGTKTGELMGSPHYMSPEQVRGTRDIDHRSDLWSLAVIAFRALTGRMPFSGDNVGAVIAQILADPIPIASRIAPDLPPAVDGFFARGFARDRNQRFQSAREMAEAFAALASASRPDAAGSPLRWTIAEDAAGQLRQPSYPAVDGTATPGSTTRAEVTSAPTETMSSTGGLAPNSGAFSPTGGPVIHSALPPVPKPSALRWLPLGGAIVGVLIGAVAFVAVKPGPGAPLGAASHASAPPIEPSAPLLQPSAPPPQDVASAQPAAAPSASASASPPAPPAKASAKPQVTPPKTTTPPPAPPGKKRPNWGF